MAFEKGDFIPISYGGGVISYMRKQENSIAFIAVNRENRAAQIELPPEALKYKTFFGTKPDNNTLTLSPLGFAVLTK